MVNRESPVTWLPPMYFSNCCVGRVFVLCKFVLMLMCSIFLCFQASWSYLHLNFLLCRFYHQPLENNLMGVAGICRWGRGAEASVQCSKESSCSNSLKYTWVLPLLSPTMLRAGSTRELWWVFCLLKLVLDETT